MTHFSSPARFALFSRLAVFAALPVGGLIAFGCFTGADLSAPERWQKVSSGYPHAGCFEAIVFDRCGESICHGGEEGPPKGGVDLTTAGYPARLYDQPGQYPGLTTGCPATPEKLIDPAGVDASLLIKKIQDTHTCGDIMPPIGEPLSQADIDCVTAFVQEVIADPPDPSSGSGGASGSGGGTSAGGSPSGGAASGGGTSVGGGSPSGGDTGSGGGAGCDTAKVLSDNCAASSCHGSPSNPTKPPTSSSLNLFETGVEARIYNMPATYMGVETPASCPASPQLLLDPAGLDTSLMWMKIIETHSCGDKMPSVGTFEDNEKACYKSWLEGILANPPAP